MEASTYLKEEWNGLKAVALEVNNDDYDHGYSFERLLSHTWPVSKGYTIKILHNFLVSPTGVTRSVHRAVR
jgi:hypothetical protein